jgi:hypothetical protein
MKGWEGIRRLTWVILAGAVLWGSLLMTSWAQAAEPQTQKPWSVGGTMGFLANTPDDTAFALNFNADANLNQHVSIGPLLQLGFTDDLALVGLSGQGKYAIPLADLGERFKLILQGGLGFVHADKGPSDTSFLIPLGFGVVYQINSQMAFKSDFLLNITDLDLGRGRGRGNNDTNIMPGLTFGVRF